MRIRLLRTRQISGRIQVGDIMPNCAIESFKWTLPVVLILFLAACEAPEDRAIGYLERGNELAQNGETEKAQLEYRNAVRLDETLVEAWLGLARISRSTGQTKAAASQYYRVTELDRENVEARLNIAKLVLSVNQLDEALKQIELAYKSAPDDPDVLTTRASVALQLQNTDLALSSAGRALEIEPVYPRAAAVLALERYRAGAFQEALDISEEHLQSTPDDLGLNNLKLQSLVKLRQDTDVVAQLQKMIGLAPESKIYKKLLVDWYRSTGRPEDALAALKSFAAQSPEDTEAGLDIYRFHIAGGDREAAAKALGDLAGNAPDDTVRFRYLSELASHNFQSDKPDQARAVLADAVKLEVPANTKVKARVQLAEIDLSQGRRALALEHISDILEDDPRNPDALAVRAQIAMVQGDHSLAIQSVREALDQDSDNPSLLRYAASIYERVGEPVIASDTLAIAARNSNYQTDIVVDYINLLSRLGQDRTIEIVLTEAVRRRGADRQILGLLAQARLNLGDLDGAEEIARTLENVDEAGELVRQILSATYGARQQFDDSLDVLFSAREAGDTGPENLRSIVSAYVGSGDPNGAKNFLDSILKEEPNNIPAHILMASVESLLGDQADPETRLANLVDIEPERSEPYVALARFYVLQNRQGEAAAVLDRGLEKTPEEDRRAVAFMRGQLYEEAGSYREAYDVYTALYEQNSDSLLLANNLASLAGDYLAEDPAIRERVIAIAARLSGIPVPQFQDTYGWSRYLAGDYREALKSLLPALEAFPDHPTVNYHIGMTYAALELQNRALEHLAKSAASMTDDAPYRSKVEETLENIRARVQQEQN